jgi:prophage tail gpP-like protein
VRRDFGKLSFDEFALTVAEVSKSASTWDSLKLKPWDDCTISLGGEKFITGQILVRQVVLNATTHAVQLKGMSISANLNRGSFEGGTGQFREFTFSQVANSIVARQQPPMKFIVKDPPPGWDEPFRDTQVFHGESDFQFLERLARMRGIVLTTDNDGNLVGGSLKRDKAPIATLVEGKNIVSITAVMQSAMNSRVRVTGQQKGGDNVLEKDAAQVSATAENPAAKDGKTRIVVAESAITKREAQLRADMEMAKSIAQSVQVQVVVQGWKRPDGKLWDVGEMVTVIAPSVFPNEGGRVALYVQALTFSQSPEMPGSITTLELCLSDGLVQDQAMPKGGSPNVLGPQPGRAQADT